MGFHICALCSCGGPKSCACHHLVAVPSIGHTGRLASVIMSV